MDHKSENIFYELIARRDFVDWVKHPSGERNYFWQKWIKEHPDDQESFLKAREFVERLQVKQHHLDGAELDSMLDKVIAADGPPSVRATFSKAQGFFGQWLKVAAILVLCLMLALISGEVLMETEVISPQEITWKSAENPRGRKSKINLPDGTIVHLNYESKLVFPEQFAASRRIVQLDGEAFFEVAHDARRPFIVQTEGMETQVLGTSFNVKAPKYSDGTEVSLVTGKVRVKLDNLKEQLLAPGEQITYHAQSGVFSRRNFNIAQVTAWKEGVIIFTDTDFEAFIDKLSKWYGVDFQVYGSTPKNWKVNGRYENEKLEDILTGMQFMYDVKFQIDGKNVTLKFDP
ncbi:FecR family protein [Echinicola rosea]|uniref:Iron dicitrate transporter FecR n=1 Tax=Echinicola rosea TaxID=1807691 RepID=A0ABQ1V0I2_9BACT|nr:FecR domain-containing protein [Echinicola rosea]GGF33109.1 iron dicitrate transporter FecR [Echinicola rosea]